MIEKLLNIDYRSSCALVALVDRQGTDEIVSVGRYGDDPDEGAAELAVAVRDDWRGAGLGTIMLSKVVDMAKDNGYTRFTGIMDPQNVAIRKVLAGLGYKVEYLVSGGVYKVNITI
jgi:acetyltransferase